MSKTILIKIGGSVLVDETRIDALCADLHVILNQGYKLIFVHGGSKAINAALHTYGITSEFVDGLRVTSKAAIKIIEMVLCGQVNQLIVRKLNQLGIQAIGLSGAENQMLLCDYYSPQHGFVGNIKAVNTSLLHKILSLQTTSQPVLPVIATIGVDDLGHAMNINADIAACHLAAALDVEQLIYLTDQDGILSPKKEIFPKLSAKDLQGLIERSIVTEGMLVKVKAILSALRSGLEHIQILNGNQQNILLDSLLHEKRSGTLCEA